MPGPTTTIQELVMEKDSKLIRFRIDYGDIPPKAKNHPKIEVTHTFPNNAKQEHLVIRLTGHILDVTGDVIEHTNIEVERPFYGGTLTVAITWTPANGVDPVQTRETTVDAGTRVNQAAVALVDDARPQLAALLAAPLESSEKGQMSVAWRDNMPDVEFAPVIADVLNHVITGLTAGLGKFWTRVPGEGCKDRSSAVAFRDLHPGVFTTKEEIEECWAQQVSELALFCAYAGSGASMNAPMPTVFVTTSVPGGVDPGHRRDAWVFQQMVSATNPMYPLAMACQHLATFGLVSRGHDSLAGCPLYSNDVTCGELPGKTTYDSSHLSNWLDSGHFSAKTAIKNKLLKPGTCYYFHKHNAMVLRTLISTNELQLLDTGGWIDDSSRQGCDYDTPFAEALKDVTELGVVVPPPSPNLVDAILRLRRTRPIGRVRLLIGESATGTPDMDPNPIIDPVTGKQAVDKDGNPRDKRASAPFAKYRWASEWLPMYHPSGAQPPEHIFSPARLFASLRGLPYADHLDVRWQIQGPVFLQGAKDADCVAALAAPTWWKGAPSISKWDGTLEIGNRNGVPKITGRRAKLWNLNIELAPTRGDARTPDNAIKLDPLDILVVQSNLETLANAYFLPGVTK